MFKIEGMNSAMEFMVRRLQSEATATRIVLRLRMARRRYRRTESSTWPAPRSRASCLDVTSFSAGVRKGAFLTDAGMRKKANTAISMDMIPSKKNMFRQVCMMPHGGILENAVASNPPNAPLAGVSHWLIEVTVVGMAHLSDATLE